MANKPTTMEQYKIWLKERHGVEISRHTEHYYDTVARKVKWTFESSGFWTQLSARWQEFDDTYRMDTGYPLFAPQEPRLLIKPFPSFLDKTFRKNVVYNENWPDPPSAQAGWVLPSNWYSRVSDVVRTSLVVKYLDGVKFAVDRLRDLCTECDQGTAQSRYEARAEGYYAAHVYIPGTYEVPAEDWDTVRISLRVEIQIRTQVQDLIKRLLHDYYEERRDKAAGPDVDWQWSYQSDEFSVNFLGHMLHYLEGVIMSVRDGINQEAGI